MLYRNKITRLNLVLSTKTGPLKPVRLLVKTKANTPQTPLHILVF